MSSYHRSLLLLVPAAIIAFNAACDSLKPVELEQGSDTAPGANPDDETDAPADDEEDTTPSGNTGNTPPRANAGPDQGPLELNQVALLDGTGSTDADGDTLTYAWSFDFRVAGSAATITNAGFATAQVANLDKPGDYSIKLTVTDSQGESDDDVLKITVKAANGAPIADAGIDQRVSLGQLVQLSGLTSSDANNDPLSYQWTFASLPPGSVTQLSGDQTATPRFTADVTGTFVVQLVVSDGTTTSAPDLVQIAVDDPATAGGGGTGSNSGDCLSCSSEDVSRRFAAGDAANGFLIGALPLLAVLFERRRRR